MFKHHFFCPLIEGRMFKIIASLVICNTITFNILALKKFTRNTLYEHYLQMFANLLRPDVILISFSHLLSCTCTLNVCSTHTRNENLTNMGQFNSELVKKTKKTQRTLVRLILINIILNMTLSISVAIIEIIISKCCKSQYILIRKVAIKLN